jgi:hypothetical protein
VVLGHSFLHPSRACCGAEGDEEVAIVFTLPVLHVSCNSHVGVLLLCSVAAACKTAKGGNPADDMPLRPGDKMQMGRGWE